MQADGLIAESRVLRRLSSFPRTLGWCRPMKQYSSGNRTTGPARNTSPLDKLRYLLSRITTRRPRKSIEVACDTKIPNDSLHIYPPCTMLDASSYPHQETHGICRKFSLPGPTFHEPGRKFGLFNIASISVIPSLAKSSRLLAGSLRSPPI